MFCLTVEHSPLGLVLDGELLVSASTSLNHLPLLLALPFLAVLHFAHVTQTHAHHLLTLGHQRHHTLGAVPPHQPRQDVSRLCAEMTLAVLGHVNDRFHLQQHVYSLQ